MTCKRLSRPRPGVPLRGEGPFINVLASYSFHCTDRLRPKKAVGIQTNLLYYYPYRDTS